MPKLKAVLSSLEGIDEALHGFYEEDGKGSYILGIEDSAKHPAVAPLISTMEKLKRDKNDLKAQLGAFDGLDAEEARAALEKMATGDDTKPDERLEQLKASLEKKYTGEVEKREQRIAKLQGWLSDTAVDRELDAAISEAGIDPNYREAVRALLKSRGPVPIEGENGFSGVFKSNHEGSPLETPIADYVKGWASTDAAKPYLPPSGGGGSGAKDGSGAGGFSGTVSRSDPVAFGRAASDIAAGKVRVVD